MSDHNQDGLNAISRKTYGDLMTASRQSFGKAQREAGRPSTDLVLPMLSEHVLGQFMQMLMLATVTEARLMSVNPYAEAAVKVYTSSLKSGLGLP